MLPIGVEVLFIRFQVLSADLLLDLLGDKNTSRPNFLRFRISLRLQGSHGHLLLKGFLARLDELVQAEFLGSCD